MSAALESVVRESYPPFFDDAQEKTAAGIPWLAAMKGVGRFGQQLGRSALQTWRSPAAQESFIQPTINTIAGGVAGDMLDRATGGEGGAGPWSLGSAAGLSASYLSPRLGAGMFRRLVPQIAMLKGLDMAQRARMGYSAMDPASVQRHMQESMAKELEPILAPWQQQHSSVVPGRMPPRFSNADLIAQMRGALGRA